MHVGLLAMTLAPCVTEPGHNTLCCAQQGEHSSMQQCLSTKATTAAPQDPNSLTLSASSTKRYSNSTKESTTRRQQTS